ncbi:O-antigen ligase family protein [Methylomagnum sp.]
MQGLPCAVLEGKASLALQVDLALTPMKYAATFLVFSLIARNNLYFNAPFEVLRGVSLVLVALMGFYEMLQPKVLRAMPRYWPQFGYLVAIFLSLAVTDSLVYVGFQTLSVATVLIFSIACSESKNPEPIKAAILNATFWGYSLLMIISLALYVVKPNLAYEVLYAGELRFRGVFPKSGVTGASAGVLMGICFFWKNKRLWLRAGAFVCAAACLLLTQSRTFWVAAFVAGMATYAIYFRHSFKVITGLGLIGAILIAGVYIADVRIKGDSVKKFARVESITNLTGRLELWNKALYKYYENPIVGLGLTAGATAFIDDRNVVGFDAKSDDLSANRSIGMTTMHSGYMQSLLDSGFVGTFFYLSLIVASIWRLYGNDTARQYPAEFYLLVFLSISNISENVIYAVTVFNSVLFFMLAAFAMHLRPSNPVPDQGKSIRPALIYPYQRQDYGQMVQGKST